MPTGPGVPVAMSNNANPLRRTDDFTWSASTSRNQPIAVSGGLPTTTAMTPAAVAPPTEAPWAPSQGPTISEPTRNTPAPVPTVTMSRGQAPTNEPVDAVTLIRQASFGRADRVDVTVTGKNSLKVSLLTPTEGDARDLAAIISALPELRALHVSFEAHVRR